MAKRASDLSSGEKRQVLEAIRQQVGDSQFEELLGRHGANALIDMLLQAAEEKPSSQKKEGWDSTHWGCFGVLWLILTIIAALYNDITVGVLFFFSPLLFYITIAGLFPAQFSESLTRYLPPWFAAVVLVISMIAFWKITESVDAGKVVVVAVIGWCITWAARSWVEGAVKKIRRIRGRIPGNL